MSHKGFTVSAVDFLRDQNTKLHHTSDYVSPLLVLRRGQPFKIQLSLSQELSAQDKVVIQLQPEGVDGSDTVQSLPLGNESAPGCYGAKVIHSTQKQCEIEVTTSSSAIVGAYSLSVKIGEAYTFKPAKKSFYLLFNPWCEADDVYLPGQDALQEYVLHDTGYIYMGQSNDISSTPWNFGQFEEHVLETCIDLLVSSDLEPKEMGDPVQVARTMSALVNCNDDDGVLMGNWSGNYSSGTNPSEWTGSSAILQEYYRTQSRVKYGQCWVFSGVLTTVMRSLGIPCRSITNFSSAHDTGGNLTVDVYLNQQGERLNNKTLDSIWNFHVWNEVWMKRKDLPQGYDGWQAIDATPQELSDGTFQCGPSSLIAVKNGDIQLPYDTKFVFSEVNADQVTWRVEDSGSDSEKVTKFRVHSRMVGKNISTKALGQDSRDDITLLYKFPEGSSEERDIMTKASGGAIVDVQPQGPHIVKLSIQTESSIPLGAPIEPIVSLTSTSCTAITINLSASIQLQAYNGKAVTTLKTLKQDVSLAPGESTSIPLHADGSQYLPQLSLTDDDLLVRVTAVAVNIDPCVACTEDVVITFKRPTITVDLPPTGNLGKPFTGTFTFKNTTKVTMENCKLYVEGLGLFKLATFNQGNVDVGKIFRSKVVCTPVRAGRRKIVARISSTQISGITAEGFINIE